MMYQRIPRVVERPIANHAESLARSAPENYIHGLFADAGVLSDIAGVDFGHASANGSTRGKIELVGRTMDRVVFDSRRYVESSLLEAKAHPARSREQIDADGLFPDALDQKDAVHQPKMLSSVQPARGGGCQSSFVCPLA